MNRFRKQSRYYTLLLMKGYDQKEIFEMMCKWFMTNTGITERDKAEVLVSYFIQNCEVFSEC
ncbi:ABC-three component system protein [Shewanella seohaensis]|uniref:ABC-three component system protein n=1 Tax=Shewanella seohaensis TaxID=755175 RepID=UPI0035B7697A